MIGFALPCTCQQAISAVRTRAPPWPLVQFSKADADSDGVLSREEFIEFASYLDAVASALGGSHVDGGGGHGASHGGQRHRWQAGGKEEPA